jgi:hypothetical protein
MITFSANTYLCNFHVSLIYISTILILIPCIIDYVEINLQLNALNYILLFFTMAPTCFGKKNAILRERICSFLSHFSDNIVGDKSEYNKIIQ